MQEPTQESSSQVTSSSEADSDEESDEEDDENVKVHPKDAERIPRGKRFEDKETKKALFHSSFFEYEYRIY